MKIEVLDTTLRDGAQAEGVTLSIDDKAECIRLFDDLKIDYIEAGTPFANPKDKKLLCDDDVKTINSHLVAFGSTQKQLNRRRQRVKPAFFVKNAIRFRRRKKQRNASRKGFAGVGAG